MFELLVDRILTKNPNLPMTVKVICVLTYVSYNYRNKQKFKKGETPENT